MMDITRLNLKAKLDPEMFRRVQTKIQKGERLTDEEREFCFFYLQTWDSKQKQTREMTHDQAIEYIRDLLPSIDLQGISKQEAIPYLMGFVKADFGGEILIRFMKVVSKKEVQDIIKKFVSEVYPAEDVEPLPKMPNRPKRHVSANNKLMAELTTGALINGGAKDLDVMPTDDITTYVMAVYEPDKAMGPFNMTPLERTVMDAVCSIYLQAQRDGIDCPVMTPTSIYKAMPGGGPKPTPSMQEKIAEIYTKMRHIFVTMDATSELVKLKKIQPGETYTKETNMLLAEEHIYRRSNGTTSIGWQLFQKPLILDYSERTGQLVNVPVKVMQIEGTNSKTGEPDKTPIKMTESRRELLAYLVRRAAVIIHAQGEAVREANFKRNREKGKTWQNFMKKSDTILYDTAFASAGIEPKNRHAVKDIKDFCRAVMAYWKGIGYIFDFTEVKEGKKTAKGLKILFRDV